MLAIGLLLRLGVIVLHQRPLISDEREYNALASTIVSAGTYEVNGIPTAYRPIGYPAFVAAFYTVAGDHPIVVKAAQAIFDTATALILFLLLAGLPDRTRLVAAGIWALYIPAIWYVNFLLSESIYTFLLVLLAFFFARWDDNRKEISLIFGICFGCLVLIKPGTLLLILFLPLCFICSRKSAKSLRPAMAALLLVLAPWMVRNYSVFNTIALSSNGGINLLIGNNPNTTGAYALSFNPQILEGAHGEFEADRQAYDSAVSYIIHNPDRSAVNVVKKLGHLFESEGGVLVWSFHPVPEDTQTRYSSKYASVPLLLILLTNLPYILVLLFGIIGYLGTRRDAIWWFTACLLGTWLVLHSIFFGGGRFHHPLMPFFALFAAIGIADGLEIIKRLSRRQVFVGSLIIMGLVSIWIYEAIVIYHG